MKALQKLDKQTEERVEELFEEERKKAIDNSKTKAEKKITEASNRELNLRNSELDNELENKDQHIVDLKAQIAEVILN